MALTEIMALPCQHHKTRAEPDALMPAGLARPPRARAWTFSLVAHGLLIALAVWGIEKTVEEPPPTIRLTFVEPPPPPPARLGAPAAAETAPPSIPSPAVAEQPKVEKPQEIIKPKRPEPERLTISKKKKKVEPPPQVQPEPIPSSVPEPEIAAADVGTPEPHVGVATGAVGGVDEGVVGGIAGGMAGGVIGGQGAGPVPVDQAANPPILIARVMPEYPQRARRQGVEGLVLLEAILNREGHIEDGIKVLQSIPLLDEAARQALRRWRFKPARDHSGRAVRVILEVPI
ncbi:MAG: energy transducer TonB, partial [Candidatus Binatia bacterium]